MSNPYPSPGSRPLEQLKVTELRDELKKRGLSSKGVKKDLFERLDEAVRKDQAGTLSSAPEVVEDTLEGNVQDEAVRKEQADTLSSALEVVEDASEENVQDEAVGKEQAGSLSSAPEVVEDTSEENVLDGDGLLYLNGSENPLQDSALIVNNALPYVGALDSAPVFVEPCKEAEKLNTGIVMSEESKDDVPLTNNMDSFSSGALPESITADAGNVSRPDNLVLENNTGDDNQVVENVTPVAESDKQSSGNEAILPGKESKDVDLPEEDSHQTSGNDVVLPESVSQAGGNDGLLAAPELSNMNSTVSVDDTLTIHNCSRDDATVGETVTIGQKSEVTEVTSQGEMSIPSEAVKDGANASVSDDLLSVADASLTSCVVVANDSTLYNGEIIEETALTSVSVFSSVHKPVEDDGVKIESAEDAKQVELLDSGEASIPTSADPEAPEMSLGVAILEAVQDPVFQQDIAMPESLRDSVMHEVVQDVVFQEVPQDTEMLEVLESPSVKMEVSEMALETKLPVDALDYSMGIKSENLGSLHATDSNQPNEAVRGMVVDEGKPNVKLEPVESETKAGRRIVPVENVKVEQQDVKGDLPKSGRPLDRSRRKESEYERSRHEPVRGSVYGSERNRAEGRSGRVFREERRKDSKERELKPVEDEFPDRSGRKRKDDDTDAKQQEPAKRMRRWNSGNQLMVDTAKPLTTGIVKEIMPPEIKKEGFAVAPPKLTPKLSGPPRPLPATAKINSEANGDKRAVPPSTRAPTSSLKVERFVRPFTLKALKDLLSEFGQCVDFWMDQIKTHCYVMYSKVDEAVAARNGLFDKQWPPSFGNLLVADFVDPSEVKMRSDGSFEKMNASPATTPRGVPNQSLAQGAQLSGSFHGHSNALAPLRERQLMQVPMKEPEPPVPTLDDLFRKTKTKPHIYYLPLTDEQVEEKLASVKNKEQQQARSKPLGRL